MDSGRLIARIAEQHGCSPELAAALMTECLGLLHETTYKNGTAAGIAVVHAELGPLATWHFVGLVVDAAEAANPGHLVKTFMELDPSMTQYDRIAEQWDQEKPR